MKLMNLFKREDPEIAAKIKAATAIRMDEETRQRTRALLSEYVKMRPIRAAESATQTPHVYNRFPLFLTRHSIPAFAAVLIVVVSGGTAAAAEGALPGDILYPIKIHVNEEMRATLATSPKAKADWALSRAERRLEEAATLAIAGKLDDVKRATLDVDIDEQIKSAGENRTQLENSNALSEASEVQVNIGAITVARANILGDKREESTRSKGKNPASTVIAAMQSPSSTRAMAAFTLETTLDVQHATTSEALSKGERTAAKARIKATKNFLENARNMIEPSKRAEATLQLRAAADALSSGDESAARGDALEASTNFNSALKTATDVESIITTSTNSNRDDSGELKSESDIDIKL